MNIVKERRLGSFTVARNIFESDDFIKSFWQLRFIPTEVTFAYHNNVIDMTGFSPLFDILPEATAPHEYLLTFERRAKGIIQLRAVRIERRR